MDHLTEQDAGLLEQAASMLEGLANDERNRGNCSAAEGAACSAHAIRRLAPAMLRAGRGCLAKIEEPAPATFMTKDRACEWAWDKVREEVGTKGWTTGDSCNFYGFFLHGWNYRGQYELQRSTAIAAIKQELMTAAPALEAPAAPVAGEWQLVPTNPTAAMAKAYDNACFSDYFRSSGYKAMLAAAPQAPAAPGALPPRAKFDAMTAEQEEMAVNFCAEIAGPKGLAGRNPDPVRLLEMAQALYLADAAFVDLPPPAVSDQEIAVLMNRSACQKYPNNINLRIAHNVGWRAARAVQAAPAAPILGDAERLAAARQDKSLADYWRNRVAGLAEEFTTAEAAVYLADRIVADLYDLPLTGVARPAAPAAPAVDAQGERDAAFEAVRQRLCRIPRWSFHIDSRGNIRRVDDARGNWIEFSAAHELFDPVVVDAAIAAQAAAKGATND